MKKLSFIGLLLSLFILINKVSAQTYTDVQGVVYGRFTTSPSTAVVIGFNTIQGSVTLPSTINSGGATYTVTSIADSAFQNCLSLKSIIIPQTIASIGLNAFSGCINLTNVTLNPGLISIKDAAFQGTGIVFINIPSTVNEIGVNPFGNCSKLLLISVDPANNNYVNLNGGLFSKDLSLILSYCPAINSETFKLPTPNTEIAPAAFLGCSNLLALYCPNDYVFSFSSLPSSAFIGCNPKLELIIQPEIPLITSISMGDQKATVNFNKITNTGSSRVIATGQVEQASIINYYVTVTLYPQDASSNITVVNGSADATYINVSGLTNGITYDFALGVTTNAGVDINMVGGSISLPVVAMPNVAAPVITTQPTNQSVSAGSSATLSVSTTGFGISYQWYLNGTLIPGANSSTYSIPAVSSTTIGKYTVAVTNTAGTVLSNAATISLNSAGLVNLSLLGIINTSNPVFTTGFAIAGTGNETILIRADGPGLLPLGVTGVLNQPFLQLYDSTGNVIAYNTGWSSPSILGNSSSGATIIPITAALMTSAGAFSLPPNSNDCAIIVNVPPGQYTAQVSGLSGSFGKVIIEVYQVPTN
jgi:BspA type Leucine rich repeat region (6 copies)/Immunoglobulin domain